MAATAAAEIAMQTPIRMIQTLTRTLMVTSAPAGGAAGGAAKQQRAHTSMDPLRPWKRGAGTGGCQDWDAELLAAELLAAAGVQIGSALRCRHTAVVPCSSLGLACWHSALTSTIIAGSALGQSLEQCSADTEYTRPLCSCCSWIDSILAGSSSAWPALHAWRVLKSGCICSSWLACMAPALHAWGILMLYCYSCSSRCMHAVLLQRQWGLYAHFGAQCQ